MGATTFVFVALPLFVVLGLVRKYREHTWGRFKSTVSLKGRVFLVTGANSGVGKETVRELAKRNATVIMACRDMDKALTAVKDIQKTTSCGQLVRLDLMYPMQLNLESFQSIREFSAEALLKFPKIHVLINNAGVYFPLTSTKKTHDGFEMNFGVNHLGHFLLTNLLLDRLKSSAPSRIVIVSSTLHEKGHIDLDDLNMEKRRETSKNVRMNPAYCASKLANLYHCRELAERLKGTGVDVFACCPGFTYTGLFRYSHLKWWHYILFLPVAFFYLRTPWQGAQTILHCACENNLEGKSGTFFRNCKLYKSSKELDSSLQLGLWQKSESLVKEIVKKVK